MEKGIQKILLVSFVLIVWLLQSCSGGKQISQAQKSFEIGEYARAAELYKKAYSRQKNKFLKGEYSYYLGECYRITNRPTKAASAYSKAVRYKFPERQAKYYMAASYLKAGKIEKALPVFEEYLEEVPRDIRAQKGLASCKMLLKEPRETRYQVQKIKKLSSKFSDYSPTYAGSAFDYVVFSSMRTEAKKRKKNKITGQGTSFLYYSKVNAKGEWEDPESFEEPINVPNVDNGAPFISDDGKKMFYTRCAYSNEKPMDAEVVYCDRTGGKWGEPKSIKVGKDSVFVAHPAISSDGEILYFVSDREGGFGGKDIWKSIKAENGWGEPVNLGSSVNTAGDEMFPYIRKDGVLYFSSNAHIGFGGLDIYKAVINEETNDWDVKNMGQPINSEGDDFGITFKGSKEEGMFSSSRGSSKGIDDLYSFVLPRLNFELNGSVKNKNNEVVLGAYLRLVGSDGTSLKIDTPEDGSFKLKLKPKTDYVILIAANGYLNKKVKFSTAAEEYDKIFDYNIVLEKPIVQVSSQ